MQNALTLTDWLVLGAVMLSVMVSPLVMLEVQRYLAIFQARRQQKPGRCVASKIDS